jgi:hypothetical protein
MIYNQLSLSQDEEIFSSLNAKTLSGIYIYYNGSGLHDYMPAWPLYAPTPMVDISYDFKNTHNISDTINTTINLNGIIYHKKLPNNNGAVTESYSFSQMIRGMNNLRKIFTDKAYGVLEIKSETPNGQPVILQKIEELSFQNLSFDTTEDNWTKSIKYTISLEASTSLYSGIDNIERYVTDRVHTWNIEPIEDIYYVNSSINTSNRQLSEYSNPTINSKNIDGSNPLRIKDFQQFRVSRRLSAKGRNGSFLDAPNNISGSGLLNANSRPYIFAKAWVEKMSNTFKLNNESNSAPYFLPVYQSGSITNFGKAFPFDHKRTVNIDIFNGSYSVDDSWLVLPRANPYVETYSIESSSDENFIKTVNVQGNIIGLSIYQDPMNILSIGTGVSGLLTDSSGSLISNFDSSINKGGLTNNSSTASLPPSNSYGSLDTNTANKTTISRSKYENAISGWLYDIKPYLYRRASIAINSEDRILTYIRENSNPPSPPNNPAYTKESFLGVVPVAATENHDIFKGTINYNYTFNNRFHIFSGVISESVNIDYTNSSDNITETSTIDSNRSSFIQRNSRTNPQKNISVEISIPPVNKIEQISMNNSLCPLHPHGYLWSSIDSFIQAHAPYSNKVFPTSAGSSWGTHSKYSDGLNYETEDSESWSPTQGRYSRNYSWIYQPHTISNDHREH